VFVWPVVVESVLIAGESGGLHRVGVLNPEALEAAGVELVLVGLEAFSGAVRGVADVDRAVLPEAVVVERLADPEAVTGPAEGALREHGAAQSCQPVVVRCPADAVPVHPAIRLNDGLRLDDTPRLRLGPRQDSSHAVGGHDDW